MAPKKIERFTLWLQNEWVIGAFSFVLEVFFTVFSGVCAFRTNKTREMACKEYLRKKISEEEE